MKKYLLLFLLAALVLPARAQRDTVVPQTYCYTVRDGVELNLDVYFPLNPRPDSACVMYFFGGGFVAGARNDKASCQACQALVSRGFTVVSCDYRLALRDVNSDTVKLSEVSPLFRRVINIAAEDCAAAVDYVWCHAADFGISRDRIVLTGCSAGAITVLQLDYCRCNGFAPAAQLPPDFVPGAVVAYSGGVYAVNGRPYYSEPPAPTFFLHGKKDRIVNYRKFPPVARTGLYGPHILQKVFEKNHYSHWIFRFSRLGHDVAGLLPHTLPEFEAFVDNAFAGRNMHYDADCDDMGFLPSKFTNMTMFQMYRGE